jgi:hypothetical protein
VQRAGIYNGSVKRDGTDKRIADLKAALIDFIIARCCLAMSNKAPSRSRPFFARSSTIKTS